MQSPVTAEEARVRRHRLQQRITADAVDRLAISTTLSVSTTLALLPIYRTKYMTQCIPEYNLLRKPITFGGGIGAMYHIFKNEGILKYYRGITPALFYTLPVVFGTQLATLNFAQDIENRPSVANSFFRGYAVAGVTAVIGSIFNIADMVHVKMSTDLRYPQDFTLNQGKDGINTAKSSTNTTNPTTNTNNTKNPKHKTYTPYEYRNWLYTMKRIYALNGSSKFMHATLPLWCYHFFHYSALFTFTAGSSLLGFDIATPLISTLLTSALTTLAVHPFDTIRTRMFYRLPTTIDYKIKPYSNMAECVKYIWDNEGMRGFYRGSGSALALFVSNVIASAFAMTLINAAKRDKLQREYLYKMHQYAQEERQNALISSRTDIDSVLPQDQMYNRDVTV